MEDNDFSVLYFYTDTMTSLSDTWKENIFIFFSEGKI